MGWTTPRESRRKEDGQRGKRQDGQHMHGYDLNHTDLGVCDGRLVKHEFQDMHPTFSKLHSG